MSFSLANQIRINNKAANLDIRYGPWLTEAAAKAGIVEGLREKGLTVGIYVPNDNTNSPVVEYWWRDGVTNNDLIVKGGELVTNTDFNNYKTSVASATATALQDLSYDDAGTLSISDGNTVTLSAFNRVSVNGDLEVTNGQILSAGVDLFGLGFGQDLSYDDAGTLSISDGNTVTLSAFNNVLVDGNLKVTNGQILSGDTDLFGLGFGTVDGSGAANYIAKWFDSNTLASSNIVDNGSSVTVASTFLSAKNTIYTREHEVVKTPATLTPGISAITTIVAVSAIPVTPEIGTLYILV